MAIQFFCPACGQPIEVDDEIANQPVACPYCSATAITPAVTDPRVKSSAPQAGDVAGLPSAEVAGGPVISPLLQKNEPPRSKLGWIALACACLSVVCIIVSAIASMPMSQAFTNIDPNMPQDELQSLVQREQMKLMQEKPWLMPVSIVGGCALPVACIVCAIIALVKKSRPRWPAIVALVLPVVLVLLMCAGLVAKGMQGASQGGQVPM